MQYVHFQDEMFIDLNLTDKIVLYNENMLLSSKDILILSYKIDKKDYKLLQPFLDKNGKFIINNIREIDEDLELQNFLLPYKDNGIKFVPYTHTSSVLVWPVNKTFFVPMFYWYLSLFHSLKNNQKIPLQPIQRDYTHQFLMPINFEKNFRTRFLELLGNERLKNSIYSYKAKGISLPNDIDEFDHRFVNIDWYKHTYYSIVVETALFGRTNVDGKFITEKTFKPIQYGHPFMVLGVNGILTTLRDHGFKTFPYLFDESYDNIRYEDFRMQALIKCVDNFDKSMISLACDDIKFNYNRFYDLNLVATNIKKEIIDPIVEFTGIPIVN